MIPQERKQQWVSQIVGFWLFFFIYALLKWGCSWLFDLGYSGKDCLLDSLYYAVFTTCFSWLVNKYRRNF